MIVHVETPKGSRRFPGAVAWDITLEGHLVILGESGKHLAQFRDWNAVYSGEAAA